jgi:hypothetical protein
MTIFETPRTFGGVATLINGGDGRLWFSDGRANITSFTPPHYRHR